MSKFDVADAALAGFGVIRRKPVAVLVWALLIYVLAVLPAISLFGAVITMVREMPTTMGDPKDAREAFHGMLGMEARLFLGHPFASIGSLLVRVLLAAAVIRAVATPKDDRFFYLRFGRGELMLVLVTIAAAILLIFVLCLYVGAVVALVFAARSLSQGLAVGVGLVGAIGYVVGLIVLLLRFSLIAPASVVEQQFRLFESWRLTKGQALQLLLVAILNFIVAMLVQSGLSAVLLGIGGAIMMATGGLHLDHASVEAFFDQSPDVLLRQYLPWILGLGAIGSLIGSVFFTLALAPWAHVYKALKEPVEG